MGGLAQYVGSRTHNGCATDVVGSSLAKGHGSIRSSTPIAGDKQYSDLIWLAWAR